MGRRAFRVLISGQGSHRLPILLGTAARLLRRRSGNRLLPVIGIPAGIKCYARPEYRNVLLLELRGVVLDYPGFCAAKGLAGRAAYVQNQDRRTVLACLTDPIKDIMCQAAGGCSAIGPSPNLETKQAALRGGGVSAWVGGKQSELLPKIRIPLSP